MSREAKRHKECAGIFPCGGETSLFFGSPRV